jgi:chromate transporter
VAPFAYRALVERRRLLSSAEFGEMFAFGQIMPGPAIANFAMAVGYRDSGAPGAIGAVTGLVSLPFLLMVLVGLFYDQYADLAPVRDALAGMAAVTGGLIVATALKMSKGMHRRPRSLLLLIGGFVPFGLLRLPFLAVIAILAPLAVWLAWREPK